MYHIKQEICNSLRKSEKYFKTDMIYLAKGGSWMAIGTVTSGLIALATSVAFANLLPKESYGAFQYILGVMGIFGIMVLSGIDTAVARSVAQGKEGSLMQALITKIRWGIIGGAASGIAGVYYYLQGNHLLGGAFLIAMFFIPLWEAPSLYLNYLQGKKRFDLAVTYETINQFVAAIVMIACLWLTDNILIILTAYLLSWGLMRVISFFIVMRQLPPNDTQDPELIGYGKHLTLMSAVGDISSNIDRVLLWHFLGPAQVAVYIFAQAIPMRISGIVKSINRLAFPKMVMMDPSLLQKTILRKVLLLSVPSALLALLYVALAPLFFSIFFPKYMEAVFFSQLAAIPIVLQPFSLLASSFTAQGKKRALYLYNFGMPVIRVLFFLLLIPTFHLLGAFLALIAIKIADAVFLFILFRRIH